MALSIPKINSNWLLLGLAIALGIGAAIFGNGLLERRMTELDAEAKRGVEPVAVVVAKRDLNIGDAIDAEGFAVREIPRQFVATNAVRPAHFEQMVSQRLAAPMKRGDVLLPLHSEGAGVQIFSASLKKGSRALTFEVDAVNSISGMLRPGDRIDLIYSAKISSSAELETSRPLLSNVVVLATDQSITRRDEDTGKERTFTTITLEVSPLDADRIIVAKGAGRLAALLRHPDDQAPNLTAPMTSAALFPSGPVHAGGPPRRSIDVEYILGGGGGEQADIKLQLQRLAATESGANPVRAR